MHEAWLVPGMHAENFGICRDLSVCLSLITNLGERRRVLCAGLANSFYVRRRPGEKKIRSKRKEKEHFLRSVHNNINGISCLCVGRKEHLMVVQDQDASKAPGWQRVRVPEHPHMLFFPVLPKSGAESAAKYD